jgi:nitric oxide dioxygenase
LGIQPAHFHTFATALLQALADTLGNRFTPEVRQAWSDAYYLIIGVMKETAGQPHE